MSVEYVAATPEKRDDDLSLAEQATIIAGQGCKIEMLASLLGHKEAILHVGTSLAQAGDELTSIRGDAHWYNVDPSYENQNDRYNYQFIQANMDQLDDHFTGEEFNRIVSYGLTGNDTAKTQEIIDHLYKYLKPGGKIIVGPISKDEWKLSIGSLILTYVKPSYQGAPPERQPYLPVRDEQPSKPTRTASNYLEVVRNNLLAAKNIGFQALMGTTHLFK
jgi:hypothetical protein